MVEQGFEPTWSPAPEVISCYFLPISFLLWAKQHTFISNIIKKKILVFIH